MLSIFPLQHIQQLELGNSFLASHAKEVWPPQGKVWSKDVAPQEIMVEGRGGAESAYPFSIYKIGHADSSLLDYSAKFTKSPSQLWNEKLFSNITRVDQHTCSETDYEATGQTTRLQDKLGQQLKDRLSSRGQERPWDSRTGRWDSRTCYGRLWDRMTHYDRL